MFWEVFGIEFFECGNLDVGCLLWFFGCEVKVYDLDIFDFEDYEVFLIIDENVVWLFFFDVIDGDGIL